MYDLLDIVNANEKEIYEKFSDIEKNKIRKKVCTINVYPDGRVSFADAVKYTGINSANLKRLFEKGRIPHIKEGRKMWIYLHHLRKFKYKNIDIMHKQGKAIKRVM